MSYVRLKCFNCYSLSALLISGFIFISGCKSPDEIAQDLSISFSLEESAYTELEARRGQQGEANYTALAMWRRSVESIRTQVVSLTAKVKKLDASDRAAFSSRLSSLQKSIDEFLSRKSIAEVDIPTWQYEDAKAMVISSDAAKAEIASSYFELYNTNAASTKGSFVKVNLDNSLYDTFNDCVALFDPLAQQIDRMCNDAAKLGCSHQTDLSCVQKLLSSRPKDFAGGCSQRITEDEMSRHTIQVPSQWVINAVQSCRSQEPVRK